MKPITIHVLLLRLSTTLLSLRDGSRTTSVVNVAALSFRSVLSSKRIKSPLHYPAASSALFQSSPSTGETGTTASTSSTDSRTTASTTTTTSSSSSFSNFDYLSHWYPVIWERDIPPQKPTKVTLFDTDYVLAKNPIPSSPSATLKPKTPTYEVIALVDRCPHKSAALSDGRITSNGHFQCAYHGWSFDGSSGACVQIPQATIVSREGDIVSRGSFQQGRACATPVPVRVEQGMVWLFPGGVERSLTALGPPRVPEMDEEGWKFMSHVRDFPVDWSILLENIMDPDHGVFAHQATAFDFYSANAAAPITVTEEFVNEGQGWIISSTVDATYKVLELDQKRRGKKPKVKKESGTPPRKSSLVYHAPSLVTLCRRDAITNATSFITAFWICPTGTGTCRFMSAAVGKVPFFPPRWFVQTSTNNFLDQDTFLLATSQKHILEAEMTNVGHRGLYVYRSPSEKVPARLAAFFDATLSKVPGRREGLPMALEKSRSEDFSRRSYILDRYTQHTKICPDSAKAVRNLRYIKRVCQWGALGVVTLKLLGRSQVVLGAASVSTVAVLATVYWGANKLMKEFYFKYDESYRDKDLRKIPSVWMDPDK